MKVGVRKIGGTAKWGGWQPFLGSVKLFCKNNSRTPRESLVRKLTSELGLLTCYKAGSYHV